MKIILDNGHGIDTPGKRSPKWQNGEQLFEWEFNRALVSEIDIGLRTEGYDSVILVPEQGDPSIHKRADRANEIHKVEKTIFVSVHGNAAPNMDDQPHGIETFYYSKAGKQFADIMQAELISKMDWKDRGTRKAYQRIKKDGKKITIYKIAILKFTNMVAILTENGFYTNFDQCMSMLDEGVRSDIAQAHIKGIIKYINLLDV